MPNHKNQQISEEFKLNRDVSKSRYNNIIIGVFLVLLIILAIDYSITLPAELVNPFKIIEIITILISAIFISSVILKVFLSSLTSFTIFFKKAVKPEKKESLGFESGTESKEKEQLKLNDLRYGGRFLKKIYGEEREMISPLLHISMISMIMEDNLPFLGFLWVDG